MWLLNQRGIYMDPICKGDHVITLSFSPLLSLPPLSLTLLLVWAGRSTGGEEASGREVGEEEVWRPATGDAVVTKTREQAAVPRSESAKSGAKTGGG